MTMDPTHLTQPNGESNPTPIFDNYYPDLEELLGHYATPGLQYLITTPESIAFHQSEHGGSFTLCTHLGAFIIRSPNGDSPAVLMVRGTPLEGTDAQNGVRAFYASTSIVDQTGIDPTESYKTEGGTHYVAEPNEVTETIPVPTVKGVATKPSAKEKVDS